MVANDDEPVVPEREPMPIVDDDGLRTERQGEFRWLHSLLYIITALIFAFFLVLAGRWVYHKTHHNNQPTSVPVNITQTPQPTNHKKPTVSKSHPKKPTSSTKPRVTYTNPTQVPNTGPGNTAAIFVGTVVLAGTLHYITQLRRN